MPQTRPLDNAALSKYEQFRRYLPVAITLWGGVHHKTALDLMSEIDSFGVASSILQGRSESVTELVDQYLQYHLHGGAMPDWYRIQVGA